jgi:hypothetical protein
LVVYGPEAINHIKELLHLTVDPDVKAYGLDLIQRIRKKVIVLLNSSEF